MRASLRPRVAPLLTLSLSLAILILSLLRPPVAPSICPSVYHYFFLVSPLSTPSLPHTSSSSSISIFPAYSESSCIPPLLLYLRALLTTILASLRCLASRLLPPSLLLANRSSDLASLPTPLLLSISSSLLPSLSPTSILLASFISPLPSPFCRLLALNHSSLPSHFPLTSALHPPCFPLLLLLPSSLLAAPTCLLTPLSTLSSPYPSPSLSAPYILFTDFLPF